MLTSFVENKGQKEVTAHYTPGLSQRRTQHTRQRSSSAGAALYSSAIGSTSFTPLENEALSSLISSLTLISDAQKTQQASEKTKIPRGGSDESDLIHRLASNPNVQDSFYHTKTLVDNVHDDDDGDFCPPPVAGYNTINAVIPPVRPKTAGNDRAPQKTKKKSRLNLKSIKSQRNLPSPALRSPSCYSFNLESRPSCNESVHSLALSTYSKKSTKSPFRSFFSTKMGNEQNNTDYLSPPRSIEPDADIRSSFERERDVQRFSAFVRIGNIKTNFENTSPDKNPLASISPIARTDLNENLIPSRRSSLRSGRRQSSRSSKDLKSLNIDQDLIEENHETVQRIRELQEARERRHNEWRKEAKRSDKAYKRSSVPNANSSPAKKSASDRSSWYSRATDVPESEERLDHAQTNGHDVAMMSFVEEATNDTINPTNNAWGGSGPGIQRQPSNTASTSQSFSSARRHRQRLSDSIKRASSIRQTASDDEKGVSDEVEAFLGSPRLTQKIRHPRTGRTIAFSEIGDPNGAVVLCCVGMGLTRYVTSFYDEIAKASKLRIITPDRPGVGETEPMPTERSTPLAWVDDVAVICSSLGVERFSLLAHSAGAIYALAAALKMPQYIRGRIHLLGPWIPPSQLAAAGQHGDSKAANLPTTHKLLSFLPASFMKAANSRFLSATSASLEPGSRKDRKKDKQVDLTLDADLFKQEASLSRADISHYNYSMLPTPEMTPSNIRSMNQPQQLSCYQAEQQLRSPPLSPSPGLQPRTSTLSPVPSANGVRTPNSHRALSPEARTRLYNSTLTARTWNLSTLDANPAIDLIICLERRRPIGFRYTDITRHVVIHHGANDTRIPLENVRWLSSAMKRCELRILEGEGHGLMASAGVMSEVLGEIGREWEEWAILNKELEKERRREEEAQEAALKGMRRGYPRW